MTVTQAQAQAALDMMDTALQTLDNFVAQHPDVTPPPPPPPPPPPSGTAVEKMLGVKPGFRSGMPYNSALKSYYNIGTASGYTQREKEQETARGRLVDVIRTMQYYAKWGDIEGLQILQFMCDYSNQTNGPIPSVMVPPWPDSVGGTWTAAAKGDYNAHWQAVGKSIVTLRPNGVTILELAHEWNGNNYWYALGRNNVGSVADFKAGWVKLVDQLRIGAGSKANLIKIASTTTELNNFLGDPLNVCYQGDSYVDIFLQDTYDEGQNTITTSATVPAKAAQYQRGYDFAKAHGKLFGFAEYGLHHTGTGVEGGDNPLFISAIDYWCRSHADILAFAHLYQDDGVGNVQDGLLAPFTTRSINPKSAAAYLATMK